MPVRERWVRAKVRENSPTSRTLPVRCLDVFVQALAITLEFLLCVVADGNTNPLLLLLLPIIAFVDVKLRTTDDVHNSANNECWYWDPWFVHMHTGASGKELTVSYIDGEEKSGALPVEARRQLLLQRYGFVCSCSRCVREARAQDEYSTAGSHAGSSKSK